MEIMPRSYSIEVSADYGNQGGTARGFFDFSLSSLTGTRVLFFYEEIKLPGIISAHISLQLMIV
jgi:hypothetical protein